MWLMDKLYMKLFSLPGTMIPGTVEYFLQPVSKNITPNNNKIL